MKAPDSRLIFSRRFEPGNSYIRIYLDDEFLDFENTIDALWTYQVFHNFITNKNVKGLNKILKEKDRLLYEKK